MTSSVCSVSAHTNLISDGSLLNPKGGEFVTNIFITSADYDIRCESLRECLHEEKVKEDIFVPSKGPLDWKPLLKYPERQWRCGKSAKTLAQRWEDFEGFPPEVEAILRQCETLHEIEPWLIFPEWTVPLPGGSTHSQNDVWVLAKTPEGLVSITIEGKVDEPPDRTLEKWNCKGSPGKQERLEYLVSCLGLSSEPPDNIYYQFIHRTASAAIMAEEIGAKAAIMLVHSFSPTDKWFAEFCEFTRLFGIDDEKGVLGLAQARNGLPLYLGWVRGCKNCSTA